MCHTFQSQLSILQKTVKEIFAKQQIDKGFADKWNPGVSEAEQKLIVEELRLNCLHELDELNRIATLFRSHPDYAAPKTFMENIKGLVDSDNFKLLQ